MKKAIFSAGGISLVVNDLSDLVRDRICLYAIGKKIFAIADDIRIAGIKENINFMVSNSSELSFAFS